LYPSPQGRALRAISTYGKDGGEAKLADAVERRNEQMCLIPDLAVRVGPSLRFDQRVPKVDFPIEINFARL
jgi:hypothetical protein